MYLCSVPYPNNPRVNYFQSILRGKLYTKKTNKYGENEETGRDTNMRKKNLLSVFKSRTVFLKYGPRVSTGLAVNDLRKVQKSRMSLQKLLQKFVKSNFKSVQYNYKNVGLYFVDLIFYSISFF